MLSVGVNSSLDKDSNNFQLDVALSNAVFTEFDVSLGNAMLGTLQGIASVDLNDGSLQIDDSAAASFSGSLDDSNGNGMSGENVMIDFSAGDTTDLESFLTESDFGIPLGMSNP